MDSQGIIQSIFGVPRALIGMVHLGALPGTPSNTDRLSEICRAAVAEAKQLRETGFNAIMLENMHDRPYLKRQVGPEIVASMAVVGQAIQAESGLPTGIQVLGGANHEALAVAQACGGSFIRAEAFVFAHAADEGLMEADAGDLLRYRKAIGADDIKIFTDIKKKHASHALTADVDLAETARAAEFFLADGVIVTGTATGRSANPKEVEIIRQAVTIPTLVGSGLNPENLAQFARADGFIVGSSFKQDGLWSNSQDTARMETLVKAFEALEPLQVETRKAHSEE
jgi:membrane complex biogenesis BtpA family protein